MTEIPERSAAQVAAWVIARLAKAAEPPRDRSQVRLTDHLTYDLAIDSLAFIELMVDFEDAFGVRLAEADLLPGRYATVGDLTSYAGELCDHGEMA